MKKLSSLCLFVFLVMGCASEKGIIVIEHFRRPSFTVNLVINDHHTELISPEIDTFTEKDYTYTWEKYAMGAHHSGSVVVWEIELVIEHKGKQTDKEKEYLLALDLYIPGVLKTKGSRIKKNITWDTSMSHTIIIQDNVYLLLEKNNL